MAIRTESWWLKIKRAQHHMVELEAASRVYAASHPYQLIDMRQPKNEPYMWSRFVITQQPDPMIGLIVGEFVHCLRSALDHIVVACVPPKERKHAGYPIAYEDLWAIDSLGQFISRDKDKRESFERSVRGLPAEVLAMIIGSQPYTAGPDARRHILGIISRLDNADKHRDILVVGEGVENPTTIVTEPDGNVTAIPAIGVGRNQFVEDGAIVRHIGLTAANQTKVQVDFKGTAVITVKSTGIPGDEKLVDLRLRTLMLNAMSSVRVVLRALEPHVR